MVSDRESAGDRAGSAAPRILVVTAVPPANELVVPLETQGYRVNTSVNASEAQSLIDAGSHPDVVILDATLPERDLEELIVPLRQERKLPVLRVMESEAFQQMQGLRADQYLADAYLTIPFEPDDLINRVAELLLRSGKRPLRGGAPAQGPTGATIHEAEYGEPEGRLIAVFSPKGGVGKTTIAANLAASVAFTTGAEVLLADGDLFFGGVASILGLPDRRTWLDAAQFIGAGDPSAIAEGISVFTQGLVSFRTLLPPSEASESRRLREDHLIGILSLARRFFDCIIVDLHSSYDNVAIALLDAADQILLVTTPEVGAMHNLTRFMELADHFGYVNKLRLVVNRYNSGIELDRFYQVLRQPITGTIQSSGQIVVEAANTGQPFVLTHRDAQVSRDIAKIAASLEVRKARRRKPEAGGYNRAGVASLTSGMRPRLPRIPSGGQGTPPPAAPTGSEG
jgi:pilus assembly protein CpaE